MSDEIIQYITTDYLIEVDGGEPTPAPIEYIVELGQVGVQGIPGEKGEPGFSPTVGYILNDNTFRINITNQDGVTQTPNLYDYFADKNGYLKTDGSNADNPINLNGLKIRQQQQDLPVYLSSNTTGGVCITNNTNTYLTLATNKLSYRNAVNDVIFELFGQYTAGTNQLASNKDFYFNNWNNSKFYYGYSGNYNEIATVDQIPTVSNATITLTQGGVTKGTFTLNGSATTINLDAGGSSITNPLAIGYTDGSVNYNLNLGINETTSKIISSYTITSGGSYFGIPIRLLNGATSPLTLTEDVNGLYGLSLNIDSDTLEVNQDGELTVIGGGGSYTAGTGIDITSDVISIDTDVVAQLSDIPDVSNFVTNSSLATTLQSYVLSSSLATVATSGSYNDLLNKPTIPTNSDYVDLTTDQIVGGTKTFSNATNYGANIVFNGSSNSQALTSIINNVQKNLISRNNSASYVYVGNTSDTLNLRGSGARPSYYANGTSKDIAFTDDIPSLTNYVTNIDYATTSVGGVVKVDGSTITIDANGVISATGGSGGLQNTATGTNSLTILGSPTSASTSINIGSSSTASRSNSVAIGNSANTISQYSVAIGYNAKAGTSSDSSNGAVAIGYNAGGDYSKGNTVAVGNNAVAKSTGSIVIGNSAEVGNNNYTNGIAIGNSSRVYGANSINLGYGANTTANTLSVGFYGQNSNHPYTLLNGTTGFIPDERLSSNIARTTNVANTDLSNLVSSAGSVITNAVMPDIAQTVYFSSGTIIELPYDAFVNGVAYGGAGTTWVGIDLYVYSDSAGTTQIFYQGGASLHTTTTSIYLPKGSYVKIVGTGPNYLLSYTPLKGVS